MNNNMIKRNPKHKVVELFETITDAYVGRKPNKQQKEEARKAAVKLRRELSENKDLYWTITKSYFNIRKPAVDRLVTLATKISPNPSTKKSKVSKRNPVTVLNRTGEVTIKYNGNKIIFDGKDAKSVINLVKGEYTDNSELQNVLG